MAQNRGNIYGEVIPDRMSISDQQVVREYPKQLIITFSQVGTPNLGEVSTQIRQHLLECERSQVNPEIVLNFCVDHPNPEHDDIVFGVALAEYIYDIKQQIPDLVITASFRGVFHPGFIPIAVLVPFKISKLLRVFTPLALLINPDSFTYLNDALKHFNVAPFTDLKHETIKNFLTQ